MISSGIPIQIPTGFHQEFRKEFIQGFLYEFHQGLCRYPINSFMDFPRDVPRDLSGISFRFAPARISSRDTSRSSSRMCFKNYFVDFFRYPQELSPRILLYWYAPKKMTSMLHLITNYSGKPSHALLFHENFL